MPIKIRIITEFHCIYEIKYENQESDRILKLFIDS